MWISEPTPVISRTNTADSGSRSSPARTSRSPVEMNVNRSTSTDGSSSLARWNVHSSASTKAATTEAVPSRWPQRSVRRPPSSSTAAPASGSAISSQEAASRPSAGSASTDIALIPRSPSVLQQVGVVDRGGPPGAVDRHDDGEADDDLRGGDDHDEERHDLAVDGAGGAGEGDQRQVHRVEHQLHAHEHDDRVAPHEDAHGADREEDRGEDQVVSQGHDFSSLALVAAATHGAAFMGSLARSLTSRRLRPGAPGRGCRERRPVSPVAGGPWVAASRRGPRARSRWPGWPPSGCRRGGSRARPPSWRGPTPPGGAGWAAGAW